MPKRLQKRETTTELRVNKNKNSHRQAFVHSTASSARTLTVQVGNDVSDAHLLHKEAQHAAQSLDLVLNLFKSHIGQSLFGN